MLLQKLASLLCEDDHVLHDVDRSGVDDPDNTVSGAKFQKQTAFQVELFSIGLIFPPQWDTSTRISTTCGRMYTMCLSNRLYCGMVYEFPELSDEMMVYEVLFEMREQQKTKMLLVEGFHFKEKEMHQPQPLGGRGGRRRSRDAPASVTAYRM